LKNIEEFFFVLFRDFDDESATTSEEEEDKGDIFGDSVSNEDGDTFHDLVDANSTKPQFSYNCDSLIIR
jgi:hypothetical protein